MGNGQIPVSILFEYMVDSLVHLLPNTIEEELKDKVEEEKREQGTDPLRWVEHPIPIQKASKAPRLNRHSYRYVDLFNNRDRSWTGFATSDHPGFRTNVLLIFANL